MLLHFEPSKHTTSSSNMSHVGYQVGAHVIQFHSDLIHAVSMPMTCTQIQEIPYSLTWLSGLNAALATVSCMGAFGGDLRGCSVCISCAAAYSEISV